MTENKQIEEPYLKTCCTCGFWTFKNKGMCHRLEQGAGKFWVCEEWSETAINSEDKSETVHS